MKFQTAKTMQVKNPSRIGLVLVILFVTAVLNYKFEWRIVGPFGQHFAVLMFVVLFLHVLGFWSTRSINDASLVNAASTDNSNIARNLITLAIIVGLIVLDVVPSYLHGKPMLPRHWIVLAATCGLVLWSIFRRRRP